MIVKIPEENKYDFAKRLVRRERNIIAIPYGIFCVWLAANFDWEKVTFYSFLPLIALGFFLLIVYPYIRIFNHLNYGKALYFYISPNKIEERVSEEKLSFANKIGNQRLKKKYGADVNKMIEVRNIANVDFSKDKICIYSKNNNWFTGNGKIVIPKEVKDYDKVYKKIEEIVN